MDCKPADRARRSTLGAWRWIAAALFVACVDGPTNPGRFGELRIRPSYAAADGPTELGFAVDSARVRIARTSEPTTMLVDSMVAYSSDTASLGWLLDLFDDEETMRVDVTIWGGATHLYSGEREVQVSEGSIGSGAADVPVLYVGPPIVASVTATPTDVVLDALGASVTLAAEARDRHNQVITTAFTWTSSDESVARVDALTGVVTAVKNGTTTVHVSAGGRQGAATVVVNQRVSSVAVTPSSTRLTALGATQLLSAIAKDSRGSVVSGTVFAWSSSNPAIASVDATSGEVTAVSGGTVAITARGGGAGGSAKVTVNPTQNVASIVVSPATASLTAVGVTQQLTAIAHDANGNVLPGVQFEWASSAANIATVDPDSGLVQAAGHGTTTVTATAGALVGSATVSVDLSTNIATVVVTPGPVTLTAVGAVQQFTAEARDASGAVVPVAEFTWSALAPDVASIDPATGVATAAAHGATTIVASAGSVSGNATLTVSLATQIATVLVSPGTVTLTAVGVVQQFIAEARDASGAVVPVTAFHWTSSAPDVASVDPTTGLATSATQGTTTISASVSSVTGTASLGVNLTTSIASIVVAPGTLTLTAVGATQQFTAVARDANGTVLPGVQFSWSTGGAEVASIDPVTGLASAVGHGSTSVTASAGAIVGGATLTVNLSTSIQSVVVTPGATTFTAVGAVQQFTAVARDANDNVLPGVQFDWASSAPEVASVNPTTGLATAASQGTTTISARVGTVTGTASLGVDLTPSVASIVVAPEAFTFTVVGATQQFIAVARDANGIVLPGVPFGWTTGSADVASIDPVTGVASAVGHGTTTVIATAGAIAGSATLTVDLSTSIETVVVTPGATTLTAVGAVQQFTAEARDASGAVVPVTSFAWSASAPGVASIDPATGLATAAGHGTTTIVASAGGVTGNATLTVDFSDRIASIVVMPDPFTLTAVGATAQFTAEARDIDGAALPGVPITWSSSATNVATMDPVTGVATAVTHGVATIVASSGEVAGDAILTVDLSGNIVTIVVSPATATLTELASKQQYTAVAHDASGAVVPGIAFVWSSSITTVATIDQLGRARAHGNGVTTIAATAGNVTGTATLTVQVP